MMALTQPVPQKSVCADHDDAAERLAQIEAALADSSWMRQAWRLTSSEAMLLNILIRRPIISRHAIHTIMYGARPDGGALDQIIGVWIHKLRKVLAPDDIHIKTIWGWGYELPAESRERIASIKDQNEQAEEKFSCEEKCRCDVCRMLRRRTTHSQAGPDETLRFNTTHEAETMHMLVEMAGKRE